MYTISLNDCRSDDVTRVGGKGASLGELLGAGIPVPRGFVITTVAFEEFLKLGKFPKGFIQEVMSAYDQLGAPPLVAVRSSGSTEDSKNASWAGELETYLNTSKEQLLANIERCWKSLNSPRAQAYATKQLSGKLSMAVVIQEMVQAEVSGVTFTVHPVTEDPNQMIIEAGWGLGEAIVSGSITPDSYVVDKRDWHIVESTLNAQAQQLIYSSIAHKNEWSEIPTPQRTEQKLSSKQIIELATLCRKIEQHYGFPCDIEWAMIKVQSTEYRGEKAQFYITQSRPITTLGIRN